MRLAPLDVPVILRQFGLRPDKSLGQNFLLDPAALAKIVEIAGVMPEDTVLEVGAGLGSLTRYLALAARQVIAVELDEALLPPLRQVLAPYTNIAIVAGDILALDPARLLESSLAEQPGKGAAVNDYLVVANIPYYITSALIRHLLEASLKPKRLVLTVQREVAARISARPGEMSLLALSVQVYGQPKVEAKIPAGSFFPAPEVDSAVVRVDLYPSPRIPVVLLDTFFRLAKAGFSQKRKMMRNALSAGLAWPPARAEALLRAAGVDPMRRAETLSIDEWGKLSEIFASAD